MTRWHAVAWLSGLSACVLACGGADQTNLLTDSGDQQDASVQPDVSGNDVTTQDVTIDSPVPKDVVTVDVPVGPPDSKITCGQTLTCNAKTQICCHHTQSINQWECVTDLTACSNPTDVPIACSGHANCVSQGTPSDICCADLQNNGTCAVAVDVSCQATCDPTAGQVQVGCSSTDLCPSTDPTCKASTCTLPGYNICSP